VQQRLDSANRADTQNSGISTISFMSF